MVLDMLMIPLAMWLSLSFGNNKLFLPSYDEWFTFLLVQVVSFPLLVKFGLYRAVFDLFTNKAITRIAIATSVITVSWAILTKFFGFTDLTKSGVILLWLVTFAYVAVSRLQIKQWLYGDTEIKTQKRKVYIYGAGRQGEKVAKLLKANSNYMVEGFIDDDLTLKGKSIHGIEIRSFDKTSIKLIHSNNITEVVLAITTIDTSQRQLIIERLSAFPIIIKKVEIDKKSLEPIRFCDIKKITITDLLIKKSVESNRQLLQINIKNKNVLITDAGSFIGSEFCRQVIKSKPKELFILEQQEELLTKILQELTNTSGIHGIVLTPVFGSFTDRVLINSIFKNHRIDTIYHTFFNMNDSLIENTPSKALNNIYHTSNLLKSALLHEVKNLVVISSTKAQSPKNILSYSQRVAEILIHGLTYKYGSNTSINIVRFGNIIDMPGSLISKLKEKIIQGGPVMIPNKSIRDHFFSITDSVELAIHAGALSKDTNTYSLATDSPITISELSRKLISFLTYQNNKESSSLDDIKTLAVNYEDWNESITDGNTKANLIPTKQSGILKVVENINYNEELNSQLMELKSLLSINDLDKLDMIITQISTDNSTSTDDKHTSFDVEKETVSI